MKEIVAKFSLPKDSWVFWKTFLWILAAIAFWFSTDFAYKSYRYLNLNEQAEIHEANWSSAEVSSGDFRPHSRYVFIVNGVAIMGETTFDDVKFRNTFAVEYAIPKYKAEYNTVWYDSADPEHSSLQKKFPLKECLSSLILWGLLIYFKFLGLYIRSQKLVTENKR